MRDWGPNIHLFGMDAGLISDIELNVYNIWTQSRTKQREDNRYLKTKKTNE